MTTCKGVYRAMSWEAFIAPFRVAALEQEWNRQHYSEPVSQGGDRRVHAATTFTSASVADLIGVNRVSLRRWRESGWVTLRSVERVADYLGRHPLDLWGADYEAALDMRRRRKQPVGSAGG